MNQNLKKFLTVVGYILYVIFAGAVIAAVLIDVCISR